MTQVPCLPIRLQSIFGGRLDGEFIVLSSLPDPSIPFHKVHQHYPLDKISLFGIIDICHTR